jgi:hypothetical protein
MAINTKKKRVLAAQKDFPMATTHFPNDETKEAEESGKEVRNQQDAQELLYDYDDEGGNTHSRNDMAVDAKGANKNRVKANADFSIENDEAAGYTSPDAPSEGVDDPNATFTKDSPNSGTLAKVATKAAARLAKKVVTKAGTKTKVKAGDDCADQGPQATTHFPNGEPLDDHADGYMMVGDLTELDDEDALGDDLGGDEEFEDEEEIDADALADDAGQTPQQSLLDVTDEHEVDGEFEDFVEPEGEPPAVEDEAVEMEDESALANVDEMSIMDVDGTDDEGDDVAFAALGNSLKVIKANRIVASMGKKLAVKAGHSDVYLGDEFQDACYAEFTKFGLRAGLKKMGFAFAKINVARSDVVNKRVEARTKQVTAALRRTRSSENESLGQCLAIAAVGINRQYFKDTRNELRAALEVELESAGVRQAPRLVRRVFASHGVDYAKAILTLANKLVSMPEETRNAFASALDMTSEGEIDDAQEDADLFGEDSSPNFQSEADVGDGFEDEFEEVDEAPETIQAALTRPATRVKASNYVSAKQTGYSVTAQAILNGTAKLPFEL